MCGGNRSPGLMKNHSVQRNRQGLDTDSPRPAVMLQEPNGIQAMGPNTALQHQRLEYSMVSV